jgi:hypothetical protein
MHERTENRSRFSSFCSKDDFVLFAFRFPHAIALPVGAGFSGSSALAASQEAWPDAEPWG